MPNWRCKAGSAHQRESLGHVAKQVGKFGRRVSSLGGLLAGSTETPRCLAAGYRNKQNPSQGTQQPQQPLPPDEYKSSGDPDDNIMSLLKEKLETLRQREELVRKGFAAGKQTQQQVDSATLQVLDAELGVLDKPSLRIATLEKIVAIRIRQEKEAEQEGAGKARPNDYNALLSAHGGYIRIKIGRIDAELGLERERSSLKKEVAEQSGDSKTAKPDEKSK